MSRPSGGNGEIARGMSTAALKGALLIGLAVIVGVFLLQRVDTSSSTPSSAPVKPAKTKTTTTVRRPRSTSTTATTQPAAPEKSPGELRLLVLNGGAPSGAAANLRTKLEQVRYTNQPQASTWSGHKQTGTTILCKAGFARESVALSQQTALAGAKVVPFPAQAPPFSADANCVIVVGS